MVNKKELKQNIITQLKLLNNELDNKLIIPRDRDRLIVMVNTYFRE